MGTIDVNTRASVVQPAGGGEADAPPPRMGVSERLTIELARLRAKFGSDPAIASRSLDAAWMSPTAAMEEDEAEFIDAVADCLGVGLSLDAALTCWDAGGLVYEESADIDQDQYDDQYDEDGGEAADAPTSLSAAATHPHGGGRRLVIP
jgi:hypothetical protein